MESALTTVFGSRGESSYRFDGKTDRQIVRELMRGAGHADARIDESLELVMAEYLDCLTTELADPACVVEPMPGVAALLDALCGRDDCVVGLLTGNLEHGAERKIRAAGLDVSCFTVSAYGSDHERRDELPEVAQRRARDTLGLEIPGERVVIIGDTPADIACGRRIGARAVAVATGRYSVEELAAHAPAVVLPDLRDTALALGAILAT